MNHRRNLPGIASKCRVEEIEYVFADTDRDMKSIGADPWLLIEKALIKTAS